MRNLQDQKPTVWASDGPPSEPAAALGEWLAAKRDVVRLPFTIWLDGAPRVVRTAVVGIAPAPNAALAVRLDDSALGIALVDQLGQRCGAKAARCVVWLAGRSVVGATRTFGVLAVGEAIPDAVDGKTLHAATARAPQCLAIRKQRPIHCARGPLRCDKCRAAAAQPAVARLLDVCPTGDYARPTVTVVRDGKSVTRVYDVLQSFATDDEAARFAAAHGLTDVVLDGE